MSAVRTIAAALAGCALSAGLAASAPAATIQPSMAQFSSVQIDQGRVLWFQRNDRWSTGKNGYRKRRAGVGAIYARTLDGGKAERVYLPPKGSRIVAFKAAHGRVAVGLATVAKDSRGPSSIVDLTPGATAPWASTVAASDPFTIDGGTCGSRVSLVGIAANADLIALSTRLEPRGKDCVLVREVAQSETVARDGAITTLKTRRSGWSINQSWNLLPPVVPAGGQLLQLTSTFEYATPLSLWNSATGDYTAIASQGIQIARIEQLGDNGLLFPARYSWGRAFIVPDVNHFDDVSTLRISGDEYESDYFLRKSADGETGAGGGKGTAAPAPPLKPVVRKPSPVTWYHACGARILRIKSGHTRHHRRIWTLAFVDLKGKQTAKLKATLPAGTGFDGCDASQAVFHRWHKNRTARQWSVKLSP